MESKNTTLEGYKGTNTDTLTNLITRDLGLLKIHDAVKPYSGKYLRILNAILDAKFEYYVLSITVLDGIMTLKLTDIVEHEED